jgi:hypothetical protein
MRGPKRAVIALAATCILLVVAAAGCPPSYAGLTERGTIGCYMQNGVAVARPGPAGWAMCTWPNGRERISGATCEQTIYELDKARWPDYQTIQAVCRVGEWSWGHWGFIS